MNRHSTLYQSTNTLLAWGDVYRYGFNGKEDDSEGMGGGSSTYDYGFRIYNAQLGKFLSVDPLTASYPWYTPYQFAGNKPIIAVDLDGLEELIVTNFYNATGQLYRTEIQVTNGGEIFRNTKQTVHYNRINIDGSGNATVTYMGSTNGTRALNNATAGSTALPASLNSVLWTQRLVISPPGSGVIVQETKYFDRGKTGRVELIEASGGAGPAFAGFIGPGVTSGDVSTDGTFTIDWTDPSSPSAGTDIAPLGVAASAPDPSSTAYLPEGTNNTPIGVTNLTALSAVDTAQLGIGGAPVSSNTKRVANFALTAIRAASGRFSAGHGQKTLGGGAGPAQVIGSQANSGRATEGGTFNVTPR
jgi:RHS repeat-associated protein